MSRSPGVSRSSCAFLSALPGVCAPLICGKRPRRWRAAVPCPRCLCTAAPVCYAPGVCAPLPCALFSTCAMSWLLFGGSRRVFLALRSKVGNAGLPEGTLPRVLLALRGRGRCLPRSCGTSFSSCAHCDVATRCRLQVLLALRMVGRGIAAPHGAAVLRKTRRTDGRLAGTWENAAIIVCLSRKTRNGPASAHFTHLA